MSTLITGPLRRLTVKNRPGKPGPIAERMKGMETDLVDGGALADMLDGVLHWLAEAFKEERARVARLESRLMKVERPQEERNAALQSQLDNLRQTVQKELEARVRTVFVKSEVPLGESELTPRVEALERRPAGPGVQYGGVFTAGKTYAEGTLCTRSGCLWLATKSTSETPGAGASGWKLVVKSGDAR